MRLLSVQRCNETSKVKPPASSVSTSERSSTIIRFNFSASTAFRSVDSWPRTILPAHLIIAMSPARSFFTVSMTCSYLGYVYRRGEVPKVIKSYVKIVLTFAELGLLLTCREHGISTSQKGPNGRRTLPVRRRGAGQADAHGCGAETVAASAGGIRDRDWANAGGISDSQAERSGIFE